MRWGGKQAVKARRGKATVALWSRITTCSSVCLFTRTADSFACSVLLVLLARSAALICLLTHLPTPELMEKCTISCLKFRLFWTIVRVSRGWLPSFRRQRVIFIKLENKSHCWQLFFHFFSFFFIPRVVQCSREASIRTVPHSCNFRRWLCDSSAGGDSIMYFLHGWVSPTISQLGPRRIGHRTRCHFRTYQPYPERSLFVTIATNASQAWFFFELQRLYCSLVAMITHSVYYDA